MVWAKNSVFVADTLEPKSSSVISCEKHLKRNANTSEI